VVGPRVGRDRAAILPRLRARFAAELGGAPDAALLALVPRVVEIAEVTWRPPAAVVLAISRDLDLALRRAVQ
jgi:hypothetical protein